MSNTKQKIIEQLNALDESQLTALSAQIAAGVGVNYPNMVPERVNQFTKRVYKLTVTNLDDGSGQEIYCETFEQAIHEMQRIENDYNRSLDSVQEINQYTYSWLDFTDEDN